MMILYKTLVRPKLDYCIPVWKPYTRKDVNSLEKVQKRFTKMIHGCKSLSYKERLIKLEITTLEDRHYRADMIQVFKILGVNGDIFPVEFLTRNERLGRGNSKKLFKKRCRLKQTRNTFVYRVVDQWNKLPDEVIMSCDINEFKSKLDYLMRCAGGRA